MAEVQAPLPTPSAAANPTDKDTLITRLDALLEQYLYTLDAYEKLTQQLSKQLSSGYFSLAQANFHNRSSTPYGQDSYDERIQATRKIVVTEDEECRLRFSAVGVLSSAPEKSKPVEDGEKQGAEPDVDINPEAGPEDASKDDSKDESPKTDTAPKAQDPIRMFGILVPPALRTAQTDFKDAVEGPVVRLVGVVAELRALEREIGRVRKAVRKATG